MDEPSQANTPSQSASPGEQSHALDTFPQPHGGTFCRGCGNPLHPEAVVCPRCGVAAAKGTQASALSVALNAKSTGVAIILSLLFTGAGHWYVGKVGRGFAFLGAAIVSGILIVAVVGLIALPVVWIWATIDAYNCAQRHNRLLLAEAGDHQLPPGAFNG